MKTKKDFLESKSKAVLREMCEKLDISGYEKKSKPIIIKRLSSFSGKKLREIYNETSFGILRQRANSAIKAYPDDKAAIYNLQKINALKQ